MFLGSWCKIFVQIYYIDYNANMNMVLAVHAFKLCGTGTVTPFCAHVIVFVNLVLGGLHTKNVLPTI